MNSDYFFVALRKFGVISLGVFSSVLVARYLSVSDRGEYAFFLSIISTSVVFFNFGVNIKYQYSRKNNGSSELSHYLIFSFFLFAFIVFFAFLFFLLFGFSDFTFLFLIIGFSLLRMHLGFYNLIENLRVSSFVPVLASLVEVSIVVVIFIFFDSDLTLILLSFLIREFVGCFFNLRILGFPNKVSIKEFFFILSHFFSRKVVKPYLITLLVVINYKVDYLILNFKGVSFYEIGIFALGVMIAEYLWLVSDLFKDVQTKRTSLGGGAENVAKAVRISSSIIFLVSLFFLAFGEFFVLLLYGIDFYESYHVALIMFFAVYFMSFCKIIGTFYLSNKSYDFYLKVLFFSVFLNVSLNFVLIDLFGIYGAVFASILSYGFAGLMFLLKLCRDFSLDISGLIFLKKDDISGFLNSLKK